MTKLTNHLFHKNQKDEDSNFQQYLVFNNNEVIEGWLALEQLVLWALTDLIPMSAPHSWVP